MTHSAGAGEHSKHAARHTTCSIIHSPGYSLTSALCPGYSLTSALYCVEVTSYSAPVLCVADGSQHDQQPRSPHAECGNHGGHKEPAHREQPNFGTTE